MFSLNQLAALLATSLLTTGTLANPIAIPREVQVQASAPTNITSSSPPKLNALAADYYYCPSTRTTFSRSTVLSNTLSFPRGMNPHASGFPHHFANHEGFIWDPATSICDNDNNLIEMPVFPDGHLYNWDSGASGPRENPGAARAIYVMNSAGYVALCGLISHEGDGSGYFEKCRLA